MRRPNHCPAILAWPLVLACFVHMALADQVSYTNNTPSSVDMPWTNSLQMPQFGQPLPSLMAFLIHCRAKPRNT